MLKILAGVILSVLVAFESPASAKITPWYLKQFVETSELIVVGSVVSIAPTGAKSDDYDELRVLVKVDKVVIGKAMQSVHVLSHRLAPQFASFEVGQRCLLFLNASEGKYFTTQGANGKVEIRGARVTDVTMIGQPENQDLNQFLEEIRLEHAKILKSP